MKNNKTLLQRFKIGANLAYNTYILPYKVSSFNNHPLIHVFLVEVGLSVSVFTILSKNHLLLYLPLHYLILFLALLHIISVFVLSLLGIFYSIKTLKSGKLNIISSLLNTFL